MTCHVLLVLCCNTSEHLFIVLLVQEIRLALGVGVGEGNACNKLFLKLLHNELRTKVLINRALETSRVSVSYPENSEHKNLVTNMYCFTSFFLTLEFVG